jgi:acyl-CoA synthetase (NDP forming)
MQQPAPSGDRLRAIGQISTAAAQSPVARAEHEAKELLRSAGIAVPALHVAADAVVAADLAEQLGFPVVLKMSAAGLVHKSDIGAVRVGLGSRAEVIEAANDLLAISELPVDSVLVVEQMVPAGVEMFVSAHRHGVVPVVVVGMGGVWIEALDDCVVIALPASQSQVVQALRAKLRMSERLFGGRGQGSVAVDRLAQLAADIGKLLIDGGYELIELNPVLVDEHDAVAVDAVIQ